MACFHPLSAWRTTTGAVELGKDRKPDSTPLALPCGGCIGCRQDNRQGWALRCMLEMQEHREGAFTTLTYSDENLPPTLSKRDLSLFLKRLRKRSAPAEPRIRFFAAGEYGETNGRPHYHALLFGLAARHRERIQEAWGLGHTQTHDITPASIAYTAGYCAKKEGWRHYRKKTMVIDHETGELLYEWQPPFLQMSRRHGIGDAARKKYRDSWAAFALHHGKKVPVPRYLHQHWKDTATKEEIEQLEYTKSKTRRINQNATDKEERIAAELLAQARQRLRAARRKL